MGSIHWWRGWGKSDKPLILTKISIEVFIFITNFYLDINGVQTKRCWDNFLNLNILLCWTWNLNTFYGWFTFCLFKVKTYHMCLVGRSLCHVNEMRKVMIQCSDVHIGPQLYQGLHQIIAGAGRFNVDLLKIAPVRSKSKQYRS